VVGLARSDASAARLTDLGVDVHRGSLEDLDALRSGADQADGVAHLGYVHDFSSAEAFARSADTDLAAVRVMAEAVTGTDKPLVVAAGIGTLSPGRPALETDVGDPDAEARRRTELHLVGLADQGVHGASVRLAPTVHGEGDVSGFVPRFVAAAREAGRSAYVGDGDNRWCAVHRVDVATLLRLALEQAPVGARLHGVAEEGVSFRDVAEAIGRHLDVPVQSVTPEEAQEHFGFLAGFAGADIPASSAATRELLGWEPVQPTLLEDLDAGFYFS